MSRTLVEQLADFAASTTVETLPAEVVEDSKRVLLDSLGCAVVGLEVPKGSIGVEMGRVMGGPTGEATVFGTAHRTSPYGAAFANAETINALDFDTVLPPGHVAPYVLPGVLAVAEADGATGRSLTAAIAVSHEISYRFGRSMDYLRTPAGEKMEIPAVLGFTATVFGAAAAVAMVQGQGAEGLADTLGIAGAVTPVNSYRTWMENVPNSTIKYSMPGPVTQAGLNAAYAAQLGHTGDRMMLDDAEFGYARFIGTKRWEPAHLVDGLGEVWGFPGAHSYKPYPHCRVGHTPLDALRDLVREHDLAPHEIDAIRCWGEAWVERPVWLLNDVQHPHEAQFSIAHGLAVGAHMIEPGPAWQSPETLRDPSVLALMEKVTFAPHPDYVDALTSNPSSRPTRIEVDARGETFSADRTVPKGSPSDDPQVRMTTEEVIEKFRTNCAGRLAPASVDALVEGIMHLEEVDDVRGLLRHGGTSA
ncbi:MmgE/PrpD family protein [Nocardioides jishulii]|uniref:MmgE/PrpD family protein n=1 Tax=Nocardioides jishulii TaxID=2575440 RepID=A0A4U2YQJ8_9ACTN|nr:MmgE/PrpD family protein [Nocardioides jishulii]QCX26525.1 MmgE/PrpD family protein [Nocardioides jishulii]TKI63669.1 MmgE/PrpD family protein [Nocardioides jishulii]